MKNNQNRKKILVVDDEEDVLKYLSTLFKDEEYEVVKARNGKECVEVANSEAPDLITLDLTMPYESGLRAFVQLKNDDKTKNIPIIIITGVTFEFEKFLKETSHEFPLDLFFEKPIDRVKLISKVNQLLSIQKD